MMRIGILAVQGAFAEHESMIRSMGIDTLQIRKLSDLDGHIDGLIIPGGESTVMGKLISELNMAEPLKEKIESGLPVFGTCAGLLLLAQITDNDSRSYLATMPMVAKRNAYGRQTGSFSIMSDFGSAGAIPMEFIRAPYIVSVSDGVEVLSRVDGKIVAARFKNQLVTAFHPELTDCTSVHEYFVGMIESC